MSEHPKHHWTIVEGDAPVPAASRRNIHVALWEDLLLRLEVTPAHRGLHITCKDGEETWNLAQALRKHARKLPPGSVLIVQDASACTVSVARGPNWSKREAGALAHIPAHPLDLTGHNERQRANGKPRGKPGRPRKVRETN